ncbi:hypothetical protein [Segnochrobactrum spirostomi]|nr:hypothetical protein [Segnochrobactrum spirostomi]
MSQGHADLTHHYKPVGIQAVSAATVCKTKGKKAAPGRDASLRERFEQQS